jgi:hypothetical protein
VINSDADFGELVRGVNFTTCEIVQGGVSGVGCEVMPSSVSSLASITIEGDLNAVATLSSSVTTGSGYQLTAVFYEQGTSNVVADFVTIDNPAVQGGGFSATKGNVTLDIGFILLITDQAALTSPQISSVTVVSNYQ